MDDVKTVFFYSLISPTTKEEIVTNDSVLVKVYLQQIENSIQSLGRYINVYNIIIVFYKKCGIVITTRH